MSDQLTMSVPDFIKQVEQRRQQTGMLMIKENEMAWLLRTAGNLHTVAVEAKKVVDGASPANPLISISSDLSVPVALITELEVALQRVALTGSKSAG